jgi:hypothetical protein
VAVSPEASWADVVFCLLLILAGLYFLHDAPHWGKQAYVGSAQYGDAEFWWNGALHFSEGIVAENPNLTFRMGYAAFGGAAAAVLGPEYRHFHLVLLGCFLATAAGLFLALRRPLGRPAAAFSVLGLVINPFTAEWLAISTSDGLGMVMNLAALLALGLTLHSPRQLRWIAAFGVLFAANALTRPLMTPFIAAAALLVITHNWGKWRKAFVALATLGLAFAAPTLAWMCFMGATTGNFALTGASQDSSAFYAASDPEIQVWRGDMYENVRQSARARYHTATPTPAQLNAEFWTRARVNYIAHWQFHLARLGRHSLAVAAFAPEQSAPATPTLGRWHTAFKLAAAAALAALGWARHRRVAAISVAFLGLLWALRPDAQPWLIHAAVLFGVATIFTQSRLPFLWSAYWLSGMLALYLTGGTWGPPLGPTQAINALGYRLGFQFFFVNDLIVALTLGWLVRRTAFADVHAKPRAANILAPSRTATRLLYGTALVLALALTGLLMTGGFIVGWRIAARARTTKVAFPLLDSLLPESRLASSKLATDITALRVAVNARHGDRILASGTSSGFLWNLPGQERAVMLLYQQDLVRPVYLAPRWFHAEAPCHLSPSEWMNRQGAWLIRSFPDAAPAHNLPYYINFPAIQAFVPLTADGTAFDTASIVVFPIAKYASQLVASGELAFVGLRPEWSMNSGTEQFPRRLAVRDDGTSTTTPHALRFDLAHCSGVKTLRFAARLAADAGDETAALRLVSESTPCTPPLWQGTLDARDAAPTRVSITLPTPATALRLECDVSGSSSTIWFHELVLTADDFGP